MNTVPAQYISDLRQLGYRHFIGLKRQNYLRQYVSEKVGQQKGKVWHQPAGTQAQLEPITLDTDCVRFGYYQMPLLDSFAERDRGYAELEAILAGDRALWLTYEDDILNNPKQGYQRVCDFIGLPVHPVTIKRSRTNPFPLQKILRNFSEVEACLQGTPYEWMLYD
ncbi:MAG: hypothetical protein F6K04_13025 [Leptolyngbya sp. SIO4C5]|nr:hypothetical protein [Leptolyngbya sp. SIO4C5]